MLYGAGRAAIIRVLEKDHIPARTVDDYVKRVRDRWLAESQAERPITRARQLRRLYRDLQRLGAENRHRHLLGFEKLIAELEGNGMSPNEVEPKQPSGSCQSWHRLTTEQIRYIAENMGQLPPGVSPDDLGGGCCVHGWPKQ
jgi:hypothetical protein